MKKELFIKTLNIGIVLLFIVISTIPVIESLSVKKHVLMEKTFEGNNPPYVPSNPIPEDGETDIPFNGIFLSWIGGDPDEEDWEFNVKYDVYFGESSPPPLVVDNQISLRYDPGIMDIHTTYYWQIVATDPQGASTTGPIWNFTTGSRTNNPPNAPEITAEKIGSNMFQIKFKLTDTDGDNLKAYAVCWEKIDFAWLYKGNWINGTTIEEFKGYSRGTHHIKAQCMDRYYKWGEWGYLELKVSKNQVHISQQSPRSIINQQINQLIQNIILHHQMKIVIIGR